MAEETIYTVLVTAGMLRSYGSFLSSCKVVSRVIADNV